MLIPTCPLLQPFISSRNLLGTSTSLLVPRNPRPNPNLNLNPLKCIRAQKSFTIILTGEQTQNALDNNPANRQEPPTESVTVSEIKPQSDTQTQATPAKRKPSNAPSLANRAPISQLQQQQQASPFIDRHVLTEHEVVPNLELNPNKPWTSRFSRSLKSSIAYRFR